MTKKPKEWITLVVAASEKNAMRDAAADLGLPLSEMVRRSIRIALPVLRAMPQPGVKRLEGDVTK